MRDKMEVLVQELAKLRAQVFALEARLEDKPDYGLGTGAAGVTRWELNRVILQRLKERAERLEQALTQATEGAYGICTECGNAIHPDRMAVLPGAKKCIRCAQAEKRGESALQPSVMGSKV